MADNINITVDFSNAYAASKWLRKYIEANVIKLVSELTLKLQKHIRQDLFQPYPNGTTDNTLSTRSGKLKKAITVKKPVVVDDSIVGGLQIGTKYASVHFGKKGQVTHIEGNPWLTIPLPSAMNSHGVAFGSARDATFGATFSRMSKKGNIIIWGKLAYVKGEKAGQTKGDLVPLFVLKHSVDVKARISPEDLQDYLNPLLGNGLRQIKEGILNSTVGDKI